MNIEHALIKTLEIMKKKELSIEIQKNYLNSITGYLKSQQYKSTILGKETAKAYLLRLKQLGNTKSKIEICSDAINFFLKNVLEIKDESETEKEVINDDIKVVENTEKEIDLDSEILEKVEFEKNDDEIIVETECEDLDEIESKITGLVSVEIPTKSKIKKTVPLVLSVQEVSNILECITNPVHNLMISFLYSTGIRLSELINMKRCDINFEKNIVIIKGLKSRDTLLAEKIKYRLVDYLEETEFKTDYLFETNRGTKYSKASVQKIVREHSKFIKKNISPQTFRNSFATHLLETGINVRIIQKLLGHSKLETTMVYTKVANTSLIKIVSPFDRL
jgi:integrase